MLHAGEAMFQSKLRLQIRIDDFRKLQDGRNLSSKTQNQKLAFDSLQFYTYATKVLLNDMSTIIRASNGSKTWRFLITYKNLLRAVESLGIEISYGIIFIGNGKLSVENYANYIEQHKLCDEYMTQSVSFLTRMRRHIDNIRSSPQYRQYSEKYKYLIKQNKEEEHGNVNASQDIYNYFLNTFDIITMLRKAILKIRTEMKDTIDYELGRADQGYVQSVGIISVLSLLSPVIVIFIRMAVNALQEFSRSLKLKALQLKKEKTKSEGLIYQMLPKSVANNLRQNKSTSEMFDSATVCFTEIDEFKVIPRHCTPLQLFDLLNTIYKTFDARIERNDVYKDGE